MIINEGLKIDYLKRMVEATERNLDWKCDSNWSAMSNKERQDYNYSAVIEDPLLRIHFSYNQKLVYVEYGEAWFRIQCEDQSLSKWAAALYSSIQKRLTSKRDAKNQVMIQTFEKFLLAK